MNVAIKIFEVENAEMCEHESTILGKLYLSSNVPTVIEQRVVVCNRPALIISPAGNKVLPVRNGVRANATDFVKLLQVLVHAHILNICHRDVKPENMFKDKNGRIILNDWSSAASTGVPVLWAGTEPFYTKGEGDLHTPQPQDDLVALVISVYVIYTNGRPPANIEHVMNCSEFWRDALVRARICDVDGLRTFFGKL